MTVAIATMLARALRAAADELDQVAAEQRQQRADWIDQHASPLGSKRHNAAVRRLLGEGSAGAAKIGRRHLLSPDALAAELQRASHNRSATKPLSVGDELRAQLGIPLRGEGRRNGR